MSLLPVNNSGGFEERIAFPVELRRGNSYYLTYVTPLSVDLLAAHHFARRKYDELYLTGSDEVDCRCFNLFEDDQAFAVSDFEYRFLQQERRSRAIPPISTRNNQEAVFLNVAGMVIEVLHIDGSLELAYLPFRYGSGIYGSRAAKGTSLFGRERMAILGTIPQRFHVQDLYDSEDFTALEIRKISYVKGLRQMIARGSFRPLGGLEDDLHEIFKRLMAVRFSSS